MTIFVIAFCVLISYLAFRNGTIFARYDLNPYMIVKRKQYYRIISHAFLHADWTHLIINMIVLLSFGTAIERSFQEMENQNILQYPALHFFLLYFGGIIIASISTIIKHRENYNYSGVGASGAVAAVTFCHIFLEPLRNIYFFGIIPIPGILFGVLYLVYSQYMNKKANDNINHDAHFYGAVYGFLYLLILEPSLLQSFLQNFYS